MNTMLGQIADSPTLPGAAGRRYGDQASRPRRGAGILARCALRTGRPGAARDRLGRRCARRATTGVGDAWRCMLAAHFLENDGDRRGRDQARQRRWRWSTTTTAPGPARCCTRCSASLARPARPPRARRPSTPARRIPVLDASPCDRRRASRCGPCSRPHAIAERRFDEAEELLGEIERISRTSRARLRRRPSPTGPVRAELALARGQVDDGLRALPRGRRRAARASGSRAWPSRPGWSPGRCSARRWASTAYALHGSGADGADLFEALRAKVRRVRRRGPAAHGLPGRRPGAVRAGRLGTAPGTGWRPRTPSGSSCWPTSSPTPRFADHVGPAEHAGEAAERAAARLAGRLQEEYGDRQRPGPPAGGPGRRSSGLAP